jgi:hypothetical protein
MALKELKKSSRVTNIFSTITDEDVEAASDDPPAPDENVDAGGAVPADIPEDADDGDDAA